MTDPHVSPDPLRSLLARLRALDGEATKAPWYATDAEREDRLAVDEYDDEGNRVGPDEREVWTVSREPGRSGWRHDGGYDGYGITERDARLIAFARNSLAPLASMLARAAEALEQIANDSTTGGVTAAAALAELRRMAGEVERG